MKKQTLIIGAMLCVTVLLHATDVQSLVVQAKGGSENAYALSGVQRITFSGTTMSVLKKDGTQSSFTIANVQDLVFGLRSATTTAAKNTEESNFTVYPNPTADVLFIKGIQASSQAVVYNLTGIVQSVPSTYLANGLQLDASSLPQGLYIIQVENKTIKFQKR